MIVLRRARWSAALVCAAGLLAAGAEGRAAETVALSLTEGPDHVYRIEGVFVTAASRALAWQVLTDYDSIDTFVSSMRESRVVDRGSDTILVEQVAEGRALVFSRRVRLLLRVRETPGERITFEDVSHRDLRFYAGEWRLSDAPDGTRVEYTLATRGDFGAVGFLAKKGARNGARSLLEEVSREMARRAARELHGAPAAVDRREEPAVASSP